MGPDLRFVHLDRNGISSGTPLMEGAERLASELHSREVRPAAYVYAMPTIILTPSRQRQLSGMAIYENLEKWFTTQDGSKVPEPVRPAIVNAGGLILVSAAMHEEIFRQFGEKAAVVHLADTLNHEAIHISTRKGHLDDRGVCLRSARAFLYRACATMNLDSKTRSELIRHTGYTAQIRLEKRGVLVGEATDAQLRWAYRRGK